MGKQSLQLLNSNTIADFRRTSVWATSGEHLRYFIWNGVAFQRLISSCALLIVIRWKAVRSCQPVCWMSHFSSVAICTDSCLFSAYCSTFTAHISPATDFSLSSTAKSLQCQYSYIDPLQLAHFLSLTPQYCSKLCMVCCASRWCENLIGYNSAMYVNLC